MPDKLGLADFGSGLRSKNPDAPGLEDFDLETDVSPLVDPGGDSGTSVDKQTGVTVIGDEATVDKQAEAFIGMRTNVDTWSELSPQAPHVDLTTMTSSNPLFADDTFHNSNVFSIRDNYMFPGKDSTGKDIPVYLTEAKADYVVIGWHSQPQDDPLWTPGGEDLQSRLQDMFMTVTWDSDDTKAKVQKDDTNAARILCHGSIYDVHFRRNGSPTTVKADDAGKNFHSDVEMEPISVGTTPL